MGKSQPIPDQPVKALSWMALSAIAFSIMAIFVKRLGSSGFPSFEQIFLRSLLNFLFVLGVMLIGREKLYPDALRLGAGHATEVRKLHKLLFFRGLAGFGGIACLFYSIHHLPLPIAMMLGWCSPLFVLLFSKIFLEEKLASASFFAIGIAFIGLVLLLDPFGMGQIERAGGISIGSALIGLLGAALSGSAYIAVRAATARVGANLIVLYFMGVATLVSAPLAALDFRMPSSDEADWLLIMGVMATFGQVTMTQGYRFAPASLVSTMSLLNAAFSAFFWMVGL